MEDAISPGVAGRSEAATIGINISYYIRILLPYLCSPMGDMASMKAAAMALLSLASDSAFRL